MPNWCMNRLEVTGSEAEVKRFRELAEDPKGECSQRYAPYPGISLKDQEGEKEGTVLCFNKLRPVPAELQAKEYDKGGYEWEVKNWGCKWGASSAEVDDNSIKECGLLSYSFDTPWGPPEALMGHISELFPGLEFELEWEEHWKRVWRGGKSFRGGTAGK